MWGGPALSKNCPMCHHTQVHGNGQEYEGMIQMKLNEVELRAEVERLERITIALWNEELLTTEDCGYCKRLEARDV